MALTGLSTQTEFLPTVRFNAREGIFSRADRIMDSAGNYGNKLTDITDALAEQGIQSSAASGAASSTRAATETATSPSYPVMGGQ